MMSAYPWKSHLTSQGDFLCEYSQGFNETNNIEKSRQKAALMGRMLILNLITKGCL